MEELYVKLSQTTVFQKLQTSPGAIEALKKFGEVMQSQGVLVVES